MSWASTDMPLFLKFQGTGSLKIPLAVWGVTLRIHKGDKEKQELFKAAEIDVSENCSSVLTITDFIDNWHIFCNITEFSCVFLQ